MTYRANPSAHPAIAAATEAGAPSAALQFEPHGGYGSNDPDGEPWPFGYISEEGFGRPIFELSPVLDRPRAELEAYVKLFTAAPDLLEALKELVSIRDWMIEVGHGYEGPMSQALLLEAARRQAVAIPAARAAIAKASALTSLKD